MASNDQITGERLAVIITALVSEFPSFEFEFCRRKFVFRRLPARIKKRRTHGNLLET